MLRWEMRKTRRGKKEEKKSLGCSWKKVVFFLLWFETTRCQPRRGHTIVFPAFFVMCPSLCCEPWGWTLLAGGIEPTGPSEPRSWSHVICSFAGKAFQMNFILSTFTKIAKLTAKKKIINFTKKQQYMSWAKYKSCFLKSCSNKAPSLFHKSGQDIQFFTAGQAKMVSDAATGALNLKSNPMKGSVPKCMANYMVISHPHWMDQAPGCKTMKTLGTRPIYYYWWAKQFFFSKQQENCFPAIPLPFFNNTWDSKWSQSSVCTTQKFLGTIFFFANTVITGFNSPAFFLSLLPSSLFFFLFSSSLLCSHIISHKIHNVVVVAAEDSLSEVVHGEIINDGWLVRELNKAFDSKWHFHKFFEKIAY